MARFEYEAASASGELQRGTTEGESARSVRAQLRDRGLTPLDIREKAAGGGALSWLSPRLGAADLCWATRELASLLGARLTLEAALVATIEQAERKHVAESLSAVCDSVRAGMRLADALGERPRDFPQIYRALVSAGEDSGDLARVMERLADYLENRDNLRGKVLTAFIYPAIVGFVSLCIVVFLLGYVVPQVIGAFAQARQELPTITRVMLAASAFVREWGWLTAGVVVAAWVAARALLRDAAHKLKWHGLILRMPMVGRFALVDPHGCRRALAARAGGRAADAGERMAQALRARSHRPREGGHAARGGAQGAKDFSVEPRAPRGPWREDGCARGHVRARRAKPFA